MSWPGWRHLLSCAGPPMQPGRCASECRNLRRAQILARYPVILMTDIANFFHTIYSHSLPWAALGKQHVKDVLEEPGKTSEKTEFEKHWLHQLGPDR